MILTGIGRLGGDVEIRHIADGTAVGNLSLAFNYGKKDSDGKRPTQWVSASLWGDRAEKLSEYLKKGTLISVVLDDVHVETYDRKDGGTGTTLRGRVNVLEFAGGKREDAGSRPQATTPQERQPERQPERSTDGGKKGTEAFSDMDDDIPF